MPVGRMKMFVKGQGCQLFASENFVNVIAPLLMEGFLKLLSTKLNCNFDQNDDDCGQNSLVVTGHTKATSNIQFADDGN